MPKLDSFVPCALVLGIALRLTGLGVHSLCCDEAGTLYLATAPSTVEALYGSRNPPIAMVLLRAWVACFGTADVVLRLLPALTACGSLLLFARLTARWCDPVARSIAVLCFAVSPFQIWYGQEVTPYALLEFGALLAYCGVSAALAAGRADLRAVLLVTGGVATAFGTDYLGALTAVAVAAMVVVGVGTGQLGRRDGGKLVAGAAIGGLAWVPWLVTVYWRHQRHTAWGDEARTSLRDLAELPARLLLVEASAMPAAWQWSGMLLGGLVWLGLGIGMVRAWRAPRATGPAAAALAITTVVALALSTVTHDFVPRNLLVVAPLLLVVIATGLAALPGRWTWTVPATGIVLVLGALTVLHRTANRREDYRDACALVEQRWRPGDAVAAVSGMPDPFSQAALRHYLRARPDIVASLRPVETWPAAGPRPRTVHVVYRVNSYAEPELQRVAAGYRETFAGPVRVKIQYRELQ